MEGVSRYFKDTATHYVEVLQHLTKGNEQAFERALDIILSTKGHVIVIGMGKSGLIGQKIAASLASTGTPSFFVHPGEALHGDLGMITDEDSLLLISNSGETPEIVSILPALVARQRPLISILKYAQSTLGKASDVNLTLNYDVELCPHNLAPTTSTLLTLALGDALTVALMHKRQFQSADFAQFHPGGSLGRRLLTRVKDVMHTTSLPVMESMTTMRDALLVMTDGRLGVGLVMDNERLVGMITDGDLRRALMQSGEGVLDQVVSTFMSAHPVTVDEDVSFGEAEELMRQHKIKLLVVLNKAGRMSGVLEVFD